MNKLAPSILTADFRKLGEELDIIEKAGAHYAHIDVMDGHFVPNITIGMPVVKSIRQCSKLVFDVHLMIEKPERYIERFAKAGADIINFHIEATDKPQEIIKQIKKLGKKAAMTLKPNTPITNIYEYIEELDMVLIMSVEPGYGGQSIIYDALSKAETLRNYIEKKSLDVDIEMDGGIKLDNVRTVLNAGVNVIVVGSAVFDAADKSLATKEFLDILK